MKIDKKATALIASKLNKNFFLYDLETTSADVKKDQIIQFAGVLIKPDGDFEEVGFMCRPTIPIDPKATEVHGIKFSDVENEETFDQKAEMIAEYIKGAIIAGYNIRRFDWPILSRQLTEAGVKFEEPEIYDAYILYLAHSKRKLADALLYYCNEEIENAHQADADVASTIKVISRQIERENLSVSEIVNKTVEKPEEEKVLARFVEDRNGKLFLSFGKHKGKELKDVDPGFFKWVLSKGDFPEAFRKIAKKYASIPAGSKKVS